MRIVDTYPSFPINPTIESLRNYYHQYPEIFDYYFSRHCTDNNERLAKAIDKYSMDKHSIKIVYNQIGSLIKNVVQIYEKKYQLSFPVDINLIVGAYGSNAYTNRKFIPDITFAMERLTHEKDPLQVIIAHEFGHVAHNIISDQHNIDWTTMQWEHPYVWLLQEGAATHFSRQILPGLHPSIYFSYKSDGSRWLEFARKHHTELITRFWHDVMKEKTSNEIFKEWFSINGGKTFGYTRLAYYIADCMFQDFVTQEGEISTLLLWKDKTYYQKVNNWFNQMIKR
ncbi:hypothetical protein [Oceanobacillus bengalensis]|uniref:Aminopeptidase n=1 Tax=Oceanobacillus bengalensis TaxID=1435466 RepID=A0A494YZ72_9BACI|nr:hypothetical protein [Oceanobacillus bengalensis]RKQ15022.1 hypothetical protein D8M05_11225 [Oceanobacillus bengalensis]